MQCVAVFCSAEWWKRGAEEGNWGGGGKKGERGRENVSK